MDFKMIREFHWLTKSVIILTILVFVLLAIAIILAVLGITANSNGLFPVIGNLTSILMQVFLVVFAIIVLYMIISKIKAWIEKHLDSLHSEALASYKAERANVDNTLAVMNEKMERMEKKLDAIERILEEVAE